MDSLLARGRSRGDALSPCLRWGISAVSRVWFNTKKLFRSILLIISILVGPGQANAAGITNAKLAIIFNDNDPQSFAVAGDCMKVRRIPREHVIHTALNYPAIASSMKALVNGDIVEANYIEEKLDILFYFSGTKGVQEGSLSPIDWATIVEAVAADESILEPDADALLRLANLPQNTNLLP